MGLNGEIFIKVNPCSIRDYLATKQALITAFNHSTLYAIYYAM